jgi:hypothetical protein
VLAVGVSVLVAEDTVSALGYAKAYFVLPGLVFLVAQAWPQEERAWRQVLLGFGALAVLPLGSVVAIQTTLFSCANLPIPAS